VKYFDNETISSVSAQSCADAVIDVVPLMMRAILPDSPAFNREEERS